MSVLSSEDLAQFRKLATKERDIVKASEGGWVGVYSALAMSLDRIAELEARLIESEKAAYDVDETIQYQKQIIAKLEAQIAGYKKTQEDMGYA